MPAGKEPKKARHAFGFFVKAKISEAEAKIGDANKTDELKQLLKSMWNDLGPQARRKYEKMEQEDQQRYKRELTAAKAAADTNQRRSKSSSSSSSSSSQSQSNSNNWQR